MTLRYASVCDGIGAAHQAWSSLGWRCAWTSEIKAFPAAVVDRHWNLPNLGDMTEINTDAAIKEHGPINLLVGGTPCQSFSVAGLRKGMDDPRGNLALVFLRLADELRPEWVVWENVPGVLSSNGGRDFGSFLGAMAELGYGFSYRVLDAQYVRVDTHARAVPQRRRRVFVVGHLGDVRRSQAVLFERESMSGDPAPRREAGEGVAGTFTPGAHPGSYNGQDAYTGHLIPQQSGAVAFKPCIGRNGRGFEQGLSPALSAGGGATSDTRPCVVQPFPVANTLTRRMHKVINTTVDEGQTPVVGVRKSGCAREKDGAESWVEDAVANTLNTFDVGDIRSTNLAVNIMPTSGQGTELSASEADVAACVNATDHAKSTDRGTRVVQGLAVRRLTPRECERLMGFPDDYTLIDFKGKPAANTPRYQALGNSMAVNVMRWIGQRIEMMEGATDE